MKQADLHWLAGLLEGEGCFLLALSRALGYRYAHARIDLAMTDYDIMARAANLLGSRVRKTTYKRDPSPLTGKPYKPIYKTSVYSLRAEKWMSILYPLLGKRRQKQIRLVFSHLAAVRVKPWGQRHEV